ncbi:MAG: hypothetical protein WAT39_03915 [Planctomycetota bacterium]
MKHLLLASFLVVPTLLAQTAPPLTARSFLPDDHRYVAHADLAAMRTRGIWDELEVSVLKMVFKQMEKEIGFPLAALDRATMVAELATEGEGMGPRTPQVVVFEGNAPVKAHHRFLTSWSAETIGSHEVRRRPGGDDLLVQPRPELQVQGPEQWLRPVLEGKPNHGMPCADVMSLLSGRAGQLAYFVMDVQNALLKKSMIDKLLPGVDWPEGEAPTFVCLRLLVLGDADDPHLGIEAVLRHGKEGEGIARSQPAIDAWLAKLREEPTLRAALPILKKVQQKRDRADLVVSVDLGRARDAVGHLAALALPLFTPRVMEQEVRAEAVPPPAPEKPKK